MSLVPGEGRQLSIADAGPGEIAWLSSKDALRRDAGVLGLMVCDVIRCRERRGDV